VAAANIVISFNHMKDTVELCQRAGRARQEDCSFVVMEERKDRPVAMLQNIESIQERIISRFDPKKIKSIANVELNASAQYQRNKQAASLLNPCNREDSTDYLSLLNIYRQKTKGELTIKDLSTGIGSFLIQLTYTNILRSTSCQGMGPNKKAARQDAARNMIAKLKQMNMK
jgi:hypothetical protein